MSVTVQLTDNAVFVPDFVRGSLAGFRKWAGENDLPEKTRVDFYHGEVWIDMGREQVFTHGLLKTEISYALTGLIKDGGRGYYFCNGILVTNVAANLSGKPDGTFVSHESIDSGRVAFIEGKSGEGVVELLGAVDMVLEVVSPSSVRKDAETLRQAYWEAGIAEYWLVDARGDRLDFRILKQGPKGYIETRKQAGWLRSSVFERYFRLTRKKDKSGHPNFTLEVE